MMSGMRIQKFGHACLLVECGAEDTAGSASRGPGGDSAVRILIDPGTFSAGFESLRELAAVLITHQHADHVDLDRLVPLLAANPDAVVYADAGTLPALAQRGIQANSVDGGQTIDVNGVTVHTRGSTHALIHPDIPQVPNVGYLIAGRLLHPGDALTVPADAVELLAIPSGAPWTKSGELIDYIRAVSPRVALPIHERTLANPSAEYSRLAQFAERGTQVTVIDDGEPREF